MKFNVKFSDTPIWGCLFELDKKVKQEARFEIFVAVAFSTLPIWLGGLIKTFESVGDNEGFIGFMCMLYKNLLNNISSGELLVYILAITGPTLYLLMNRNDEKGFKGFRGFIVISSLIGIVAAVMYFHAKDIGYAGKSVFVLSSFVMYVFTLFLIYPFYAYRHRDLVTAPKKSQEDEEDYMAGYSKRRRQGGADGAGG